MVDGDFTNQDSEKTSDEKIGMGCKQWIPRKESGDGKSEIYIKGLWRLGPEVKVDFRPLGVWRKFRVEEGLMNDQ